MVKWGQMAYVVYKCVTCRLEYVALVGQTRCPYCGGIGSVEVHMVPQHEEVRENAR